MADFISGSFSRIDSFRQCPKKFFELTVRKPKRVAFVQTDAQRNGERIHKIIEDAIAGAPVPHGYEKYGELARAVTAIPGQTFTEMNLTIDRNGTPCGSNDWDRAYMRARVDVAKMNKNVAWAGDWKTGKRTFDELQMKITAGMMFVHFPDLDTVATNYIFTEEKSLDQPTVYRREDLHTIWREPLDWMNRIQEAYKSNDWPARPKKNGPPFCAWCPVFKAGLCEEAVAVGVKPR